MFPNFRRCCFGIAFLLTLVHRAPGDDDRQLFGKPEKPEDYWRRVKFEIEVGKFDYAAKYLKGFVEELKKLKADEAGQILVKIEEKEGISAFLRLKRIPPLLEDKKDQKALEAVIKQLNEQVSTAVSKFLNDPVRIRKYLKNLTKTPEERAWAIKELRRSRQAIIPYVIQELQFTAGKVEHEKIMTALSTILRTDQAILPPLLAALDLNDNILRADILILLRDHGRARDVAHLWYLSAAKNLPLAVRTFTTKIIARLLETEVDQLPHAKVALTKLAEIYYRHQVKFTNSNEIVVWKLDPKKKELAPVKMTANQVEEYYGLRYARQALDLDAEYQPAQVMFLSVALDKAYGSDIHLPIKAKAPRIKALMATLSPELLTDVLDRAMRERRLPVILGALQTLGETRAITGVKKQYRQGPVLIRALSYPDRRVQMTAAEALMRLPGKRGSVAATRMVEICRRAVLAESEPQILVGYFDQNRSAMVRKAVIDSGYQAVEVRSRVALIKRLREASDVDAVILDHSFPMWERELPFVLAEIRNDSDGGLLPILITVPAGRELSLRRFVQRYPNIWVVPVDFEKMARLKVKIIDLTPDRQLIDKLDSTLVDIKDQIKEGKDEKKAIDKVRQLVRDLRGKLDQPDDARDLLGTAKDQLKKLKSQLKTNVSAAELIDNVTSQLDEVEGRLSVKNPEKNLILKFVDQMSDLKTKLKESISQAMIRPLSKAERKVHATVALEWLGRMARGNPAGFDIRPAQAAIYKAFRSNEVDMVKEAIPIVGKLPGQDAQRQLAAFVLDPGRDKLRPQAAEVLNQHIQKNGILLAPIQITKLKELRRDTADAKLKESLGLVISSLNPSSKKTGERLKGYEPDEKKDKD